MSNSKSKPTAVLLMAYGSPETIAEVGPYFTHIRGGVRPDEKVIKVLEERYQAVGGKTPLVAITNQEAAELQKFLDAKYGPGKYLVFVGMKHWHPYIKDVLQKIAAQGISEVIAIALAPHYSQISIGGYKKALDEAGAGLQIKVVDSWHANSHLIACISRQLGESLKNFKGSAKPHVVFTAHSLPERIRTWHDPYESELLKTAELVAADFPGLSWSFSFQSAGHTGEPWIGPDILENLEILQSQGKTDILICSVGFVADNLEIIFDLDIEAQEKAKELGIHLERVPMRNTEPEFVAALGSLVE